ncbi:MAG: SMC-Scp complex subunit ScpB [Candidatus Omnitrophota bacterium]|nr:SMC-Scp complex subunit ScpB [Candidatus Omnitrophota bacterium]
MDRKEAKKIIEAILFVSDKPVSISTLKDVLKDIEPTEVRTCIEELNNEYNSYDRSFSIKEIAGGFQMLTDPVYSTWISSLYKKPADRMTGPALETLAIIAYKQPLTRSDIEVIRGVNVDGVLHTLEERNLIRTRGRVDAPGRPILYGTTNEFLQHFGLKSLEDLPKLKEFQESDLDFVKEQQKTQAIDTQTGELKTIDKSPEQTTGLEPAVTAEKENKDGTEGLEKSN